MTFTAYKLLAIVLLLAMSACKQTDKTKSMTAIVTYKGELRCECTHQQSGTVIETDAPSDNRGKGERFSPTDTLCVSLATCMITTIGIRAMDLGIDISNSRLEITKHMASNPRRINKIEIILHIIAPGIDEATKTLIEKIGDTCPVMKSLHPDVIVDAKYLWS